LKSIGRVLTISHTGKLITKAETVEEPKVPLGTEEGSAFLTGAPRTGSKVYDNRKGKVGTVTKVFGPVAGPFIAIRPFKKGKVLLSLIDKELYSE
jgi:rRNA processing protein Gar1